MPATHKVYRATTDKLNDAFERIEAEGDEVVPPLYWLGGRDWLILYRTGSALRPHSEPDLSELFRGGTQRGTREGRKP